MKKCPVCGKDKSEFEMRPLVNVEELAVGDAMSDQDSKQDVGGAKVHVVCRSCWLALLDGKSKAEIMELLETICGILFEVARERREKGLWAEPAVLIEKMSTFPHPIMPMLAVSPCCPTLIPFPGSTGDIQISDGTHRGNFLINNISESGVGNNMSIRNLAAQWGDMMFESDDGEAWSSNKKSR
jgi:hypothetical protein